MKRMLLSVFDRCNTRLITSSLTKHYVVSSVRLCSNEDAKSQFLVAKPSNKTETNAERQQLLNEKRSVLWLRTEELLSEVRSFTHVNEVLKYIQNNPNIDPLLYASIFSSLHKLQKSGCTTLSTEKLFHTREIEKLSQYVKKNVRVLKVEDAITILKVLVFNGVPSNSILCQHLLQMISQSINRLDIQKLTYLAKILRSCQKSPLTDAIKAGLPFVFQTHVLSQLDVRNSKLVAEAMIYAFREKDINQSTKEALLQAGLEISEDFDVNDTIRMVLALSYRDHDLSKVLDMYSKLMKNLTKNIDLINKQYLIELVDYSIERFINTDVNYYNESLVNGTVDYFIINKIDLRDTGSLLRILNRVSYYCPKLLDFIDEELRDTKNFENTTTQLIFAYVTSCSNCLHKPLNWPSYESKLLSYIEARKDDTIPLVRFVTDLIILKCWPTSLIEFCFSKEFLDRYLGRGYTFIDSICVLNLYQIVQAFYPGGYEGPFPEREFLEELQKVLEKNREYPLVGSLQHAVGGPEYVLTGVRTKLGHLIEYLVVKQKSGEVLAINPDRIEGHCQLSVESLEVPEDSFIIGIVTLSPSSYCLDGYRLRGKINMNLRTLESLGIVVVPISQVEWLNLMDEEKIPYLLDKINTSIPR